MRASYNDIVNERGMWLDLWAFRKAFYNPEDKSEYWREMHAAVEDLAKKHDSEMLKNILLVMIGDLEGRAKK